MEANARLPRLRLFTVAAMCTAVGLATLLAQTPQQPVFRAGVDVVPIEVVVVDGTGQPVHGLAQNQFRVFDRRQPQSVDVFEEVTRDPAAITAAPIIPHVDTSDNRTAASQRMVVMVIDDIHIDKAREDRAKQLAKEVIDKIGAGASMAVLFTGGSHSTEVTEDRGVLMAAVDTLKAKQAERRPETAPESPGGRGQTGQQFFQGIQEFKSLDDASRMLAADSIRRKTFVMISEGINKVMTGMFDNAFTPCEATFHAQNPAAGQAAVPPCGSSIALHQMMEDMRRSNVTMYILDPRGAVSEQDLDKENFPPPGAMAGGGSGVTSRAGRPAPRQVVDPHDAWNNPVRRAQSGANIMAEASGGFAVTNSDDFGAGIQMISDDLNHYYLLGFHPTDPNGSDYRQLNVSVVGHPDWVLRYRRGYVPGGPPAPHANSDPLITAVTPKTDLPLRLVAVPLPAAAGAAGTRVSVVLEVAGAPAALVNPQNQLHDDCTFQVVAVNMAKKQATARIGNSAKLVLKPVGATATSVAYAIPGSLSLPPGDYQLRASVASGATGKAGSVYLMVNVPDFSSAPLSVSGLDIGYADGPHVAVASTETPENDLGLPFVPSLDRTFSNTDSLRVYADIERSDMNAPVKATASITDAKGQPIVSSTQQIAAGQHGRMDTTLSLASAAPGVYQVSISASDGKHNAVREVGFLVK